MDIDRVYLRNFIPLPAGYLATLTPLLSRNLATLPPPPLEAEKIPKYPLFKGSTMSAAQSALQKILNKLFLLLLQFKETIYSKKREIFFNPMYQIFYFLLHFKKWLFSKSQKFSKTAPRCHFWAIRARKPTTLTPLRPKTLQLWPPPLGTWKGGRKVFKVTWSIYRKQLFWAFPYDFERVYPIFELWKKKRDPYVLWSLCPHKVNVAFHSY